MQKEHLSLYKKPPISIFGHTQSSYAQTIKNRMGRGYEHASLVYREWYQQGKVEATHLAFRNAAKLLEEMRESTDFTIPPLVKRLKQEQTEKFVLKLSDGLETESVVIPMKFGWSLCISSQVGCRMGCAFCQTGKMGLVRHLTAEEIVVQLFVARKVLGYDVRNVVFMGMGEPFDNFEEAWKAIEIFIDPAAFGIAKRHITISTSGLVAGIRKLMEKRDVPVQLAVSINAPNDAIRTKIMPVNRKHALAELRQVLVEYCALPKRSILIEYVLLSSVNDHVDHAEELGNFLTGLPVKINLIPYNPQNPDRFAPPPLETTEAFAKHLRQKGFRTLLRLTKGNQIMAACGQLGNLELKRSRERCSV